MIEINIPGSGLLRLAFLVCDYNGTLARDGHLIQGVEPLIQALSVEVEVHVVTADTFGIAAENLQNLPVKLTILPQDDQDKRKAEYIRKLGVEHTVALGNGRNDMKMLQDAALGICVIEEEGTSVRTMQAADIVCRSVVDALELLLNHRRMIATLRT